MQKWKIESTPPQEIQDIVEDIRIPRKSTNLTAPVEGGTTAEA